MSVPVPWGQALQPENTVTVVTTLPWATFMTYISCHVSLWACQAPLPATVYRARCSSLGKSFCDRWTRRGENRSQSLEEPTATAWRSPGSISKPPLLAESGKAATGAAGKGRRQPGQRLSDDDVKRLLAGSSESYCRGFPLPRGGPRTDAARHMGPRDSPSDLLGPPPPDSGCHLPVTVWPSSCGTAPRFGRLL